MAQLLLEILSEEIPARMQARAEGDLSRLLGEALEQAGLQWDALETFAGPRRLTAVVEGLPEATGAVREERKGPRQGAPDKAIEGFLRSAGLDSLEQCETRDDGKGPYYVAVIERPGRKTADVIAEAVPAIVRGFPWPKSMKFGEGARAQRWVRPLRRILCLFGGAVVPAEVFGIKAGNQTEGHRVHGPGPFAVKDFADYEKTLREKGHVILRAQERKRIILEQARAACAKAGLELIEDEGLLAEVAGLAEWPVALLGDMAAEFLDLPPEVIRLSMKTHQKYFAVRDPKTGQLAPKFVVIANQIAPDGGEAIAAGNARVLSARLNDARYFWDNDRATGLSAMAEKLSAVTFHEKLGSMADKTARVAALARELAPAVGADPDLAERAAKLAKADLVSEMVYEFPELQGVMGRYYALEAAGLSPRPSRPASRGPQDEGKATTDPHPEESRPSGRATKDEGPMAGLTKQQAEQVAAAIADHYKPLGPSDAVPTAPVSAAVGLADKLDTLVGFWAIDEKPTGSKDPFALRRAALGVIRIVLGGGIRLPLRWIAYSLAGDQAEMIASAFHAGGQGTGDVRLVRVGEFRVVADLDKAMAELGLDMAPAEADAAKRIAHDLLAFFADRLKVHLKDEGVRHDVIDAVFAPRPDGTSDDDLVRVTTRARALQAFLDTDDGAALLAGYRRAANILKIEEKKDGASYDAEPEAAYLKAPPQAEEKALIAALAQAVPAARKAVQAEDFAAAMAALAALRAPVDAFFDSVTVNADDAKLRANRLRLLSRIRAAAAAVADFGRIEG